MKHDPKNGLMHGKGRTTQTTASANLILHLRPPKKTTKSVRASRRVKKNTINTYKRRKKETEGRNDFHTEKNNPNTQK